MRRRTSTQGDQPHNSVTNEETGTVIKTLTKPKPAKDDYHGWEQVTITKLRTGHNRLNAHMYAKLKLSPSPRCACGLEEQTAEHILQRCPLLEQKRRCMANLYYHPRREVIWQDGGAQEESVLHRCGRGDGVDSERQ